MKNNKLDLENKKERDSILDSLKGISILGVVLVHSPWQNLLSERCGQIITMGATGTVVFLLISTYLTICSYERKVILGDVQFFPWLLKKVFRIIPLYYLFLTVSFITEFAHTGQTSLSNVIMHLFFVNNFIPTYANSPLGIEWFVGVVVLFYLITPFFYRLLNNEVKSFAGFISFSSISLLINHYCVLYLFNNVDQSVRYYYNAWIGGWFFLVLLDVYTAALTLFHLSKKMKVINDMPKTRRALLSLTLLVVFCIMFVALTLGEFRVFGVSSRAIYVIMYSLLIVSLYVFPNIFFVNPLWAFIGKYTFGVYLCHTMVINFVYTALKNVQLSASTQWTVGILSSFVGSLIVSIALTDIIEKPLTQLSSLLIDCKNKNIKG